MNKVYNYLPWVLFLSLAFSSISAAQEPGDCDCVYPVIFVHGWAGDGGSWSDFYENPDFEKVWGEILPDNAPPQIYHAVLNAQLSTNIWGLDNTPDDDPNTSAFEYVNDDVIVHEQFENTAALAPGCAYAINFKAFWNQDQNAPRVELNNWNIPPILGSDSNESSAFKQGYALGRMIKYVLALTGKEKVILVAHSMGGLAAREYLQRMVNGIPAWWVEPGVGGHKVAKLFTVSTPHLGSVTFDFLDGINTETTGFDLRSEAVRDLRYYYEVNGIPFYEGAYLFGIDEANIPAADYYNADVNCNAVTGQSPTGPIQSLNARSIVPWWEGTTYNDALPLPQDVKYTYYVSDKIPTNGEPGDFIVEADRQWLYSSGNGSTQDHLAGNSLPEPSNGTPYQLSDRITSPYNRIHSNIIDAIQTSVIEDTDVIASGLDEGDYPYFAGKVEPGNWYKGLPQKRAGRVPADSDYTSLENNLVDGDWYKVEITEETPVLELEIRKPDNASIITRVDLYYDQTPGPFANNSDNTLAATSGVNGPATMKVSTAGVLSSVFPGTYYFRITNALFNLPAPLQAWRYPYQFRVNTPLVSEDCTVKNQRYIHDASIAADCGLAPSQYEDCIPPYSGQAGKLRVPLKFHLGTGANAQFTQNNLENLIAAINLYYSLNPADLPLEYYIADIAAITHPGLVGNDYLFNYQDDCIDACGVTSTALAFQEIIDAPENENVINIFLVDEIYTSGLGDNQACVCNNSLGIHFDGIQAVWATNSAIAGAKGPQVLAHELGHYWGLKHPFDNTFPGPNDYCANDGISDTDPGPQGSSCNLMDYNELGLAPPFQTCTILELTDCQKAKMLDVLFNCETHLCVEPGQPLIKLANDQIVTNLEYSLSDIENENFDVLFAELSSTNATNTGNWAYWSLENTIFEYQGSELNLNSLIGTGMIEGEGTYILRIRDQSIYNPDCYSDWVTVTIIVGCNNNGICDPTESYSSCPDCQPVANCDPTPSPHIFLSNPVPGSPEIVRLKLEGTDLTSLVSGAGLVYSIEIDEANGKMYWIKTGITSPKIFRANLNGSDVEEIPVPNLNAPVYLALDLPNGQMYWGEQGSGRKIRRAKLDGSGSANVVINLQSDPFDLELDLVNRHVYWTEPGSGNIKRGNLDGFNSGGQTILTTSGYPGALALDVPNGKLYLIRWTGNSIARANLDGSGLETLISQGLNQPRDIEVFQNKLYWANPGNQLVQRADLDGSDVEDVITGVTQPYGIAFCASCSECSLSPDSGMPTAINRIEYFIDTDPGYGQGTAISNTPGPGGNLAFSAPTANLGPGIHNLFVRARNEDGRWSFTAKKAFYIQPPLVSAFASPLAYLEYFLDTDPGYGNGLPLALNGLQNSEGNYLINLPNPTPGVHSLYVRARNQLGAWSFAARKTFFVYDAVAQSPPSLSRLEYFIDADPGYGAGSPLPLTDAYNSNTSHAIQLGNIEPGQHTLFVRAQDSRGNWSFVQIASFEVLDGDAIPPTALCRNTTVQLDEQGNGSITVADIDAGSSDNDGIASMTVAPNTFDCSQLGGQAVNLAVTDHSGNSSSCMAIVSVVDALPPVAICQDYTVTLNGEPSILLLDSDVWDEAVSQDNCGMVYFQEVSPSEITCDDLGLLIPATVTINDGNGNTATCQSTITVGGLPCGFGVTESGVDCSGYEANYDTDAEAFTLTAPCVNNFLGYDAIAFAGGQLCGDFMITARIESISTTGYAGLVARQSAEPGSKMAGLYSNLTPMVRWEARTATNGSKSASYFLKPLPYWLRLVRQGNWFYGFNSFDGINFSFVTIQSIPMPACINVGLAAFSNIPGTPAEATFSNVELSGSGQALYQFLDIELGRAGISREFSLFPNPAREAVTIALEPLNLELDILDTSSKLEFGASFRLRNGLGQLLEERRAEDFDSGISWDIHHLPPGLYYMEVQFSYQPPAVLKFVKME
ncbi:MAG: hypothetical protein H6564_06570 [Lewinellaceae bacterium]|nr:hypothetical protein [Lewinellaceae bacterium]